MQTELKEEMVRLLPALGNEKGKPVVDTMVEILEGKMWGGLDFPHQPHHNLRVQRDAQCIGVLMKMAPWELTLLEKGALVHDLGRNFVEQGLLVEEEHHNGSYVLAKVISTVWWGFSEEISDHFAEGVALHIEDVLDRNVARWVRALRDADRTARLGIGGIIEQAWYLGYRDDYISGTSLEKMALDQVLFDLTIPTTPKEISKYDEKPRRYLKENILPVLEANGSISDLALGTEVLLERIYGVQKPRKERHERWKIEPVSPEAQFLAEPRVASMKWFLEEVGFSL